MALLEVSDLHAGYGPVQVLHGIELRVEPGERLALIGRNGVGKTTLLKALMGLADVRAGAVRFEGRLFTIEHDHNHNLKFQPVAA